MFVRSISDAAHRVAQRVVAAIFLLLPASRLPPSFVYCARPLVEHPMARGPLTVGNLRDSRNGRFDSVFSQSRDLEKTIEDNADNWNGSPPFRGDCYCDRRNDDTRRIIFTFYIDDTMKFDIEIFVLPRLIIFRRGRRYKCWFVNFIKIDLFYI